MNEDFKNQRYELSVLSAEGKILTKNDFTPKNGVNFVDLNFYPEGAAPPSKTEQSTVTNKYTEPKAYYFEQSKYDLLPDNKSSLDSLAAELSQLSTYTVHIKGFTDKVGDAKLNSVLAEYRSKVVANYLIKQGIKKEKIATDWENRVEVTENSDAQQDLKKYRKVEINIKL